jgi:hypothetical protein
VKAPRSNGKTIARLKRRSESTPDFFSSILQDDNPLVELHD